MRNNLKKTITKVTSLVMICVLLLTVLSVQVQAAEIQNENENSINDTFSEESEIGLEGSTQQDETIHIDDFKDIEEITEAQQENDSSVTTEEDMSIQGIDGNQETEEAISDVQSPDETKETESPLSVEEAYIDSDYEFAPGVIVVPKDIFVEIDEGNNLITIYDYDGSIQDGDIFAVYCNNLPIGYEALSVSKENQELKIYAQKTDQSIFRSIDEEGTIKITAQNSYFTPASGVTLSSDSDDSIIEPKYENGKLSLEVSYEDAQAEVYISDLYLEHSFSDA